ncbi:hypothetical protein F4820DRAFT_407779 [Hypoxylon rubiginosum]|uniref:Uncharacterized protein n=1 Tax=Hypoxylon rubiginosum TaxID=110542 RepID=A0ACB9ZDI3_9PEZI|nr:hypothetical protein F4820DRAFT_407779 [Hypoxylon rubiginosum]
MPSLTTIPLEILIEISSLLKTTNDFGALRLTCKYIEASLFKTFARRYFNNISFCRVEHNLRAFVNISKSRLSPYLKYVAINSEPIPFLSIPDIDTSDIEEIASNARFYQQCANQMVFLNTGQDQLMLTEAFCNLSHLEQVIIRGPQDHPYFQDDSTLTTYVWQENIDRMSNASCLQNVLCALAKSGTKLKQLKIEIGYSMNDDAYNMPGFMEEAILPVLVNLEALDLRHPDLDEPAVVCLKGQKLHKIYTYYLRKFLLRATQIKHLCLVGTDGHSDLWEWLSDPVSNEQYDGPRGLEPPISPTFMNLYELTLKDCLIPIPPNHLLTIIQKFSATMRELCLYRISLEIDNLDEWVGFAAQLARVGRHLKKISLEHVFLDARVDQVVGFNSSGERKCVYYYAGDKMDEVLEGLVDVIFIKRR